MIYQMNKRVVGVVSLLGLALAAGTRPAQAQDGNGWFDESSAGPQAAANSAVGAAPAAPSAPVQAAGAAPPAAGPHTPVQPDNVPETDPRAITEFRSALDPYGTWVHDQTYGTVWVPNPDIVGADFKPYVTAGRWQLTQDNDWLWQSDYPFGGVVFHYGRWVWVPNTGWGWVAGRRYANAWVNWRISPDSYGYIGWAPMPPAWGWYGGFAISRWWYPPSAYVFCHTRYAFAPHVHPHIVRDPHMVREVAGRTRNYSDGPQHIAATPRILPANSPPPRGPSLQTARIPATAVPATRVPVRLASATPRAVPAVPYGADGARRTFSSGSRPLAPSAYAPGSRPVSTSSYRAPTYANPSMYARPRPAYTAPLGSSNRRAPNLSGQSYSRPTQYGPPMTRYSSPSPGYSPSFSGPSRSYSAPSFHSSPSFSSPSFHSAPSFNSAPSRSFTGPSRR